MKIAALLGPVALSFAAGCITPTPPVDPANYHPLTTTAASSPNALPPAAAAALANMKPIETVPASEAPKEAKDDGAAGWFCAEFRDHGKTTSACSRTLADCRKGTERLARNHLDAGTCARQTGAYCTVRWFGDKTERTCRATEEDCTASLIHNTMPGGADKQSACGKVD